MSKIQVLDKYIANRIAAGEVVEKPASVVKELIENSIDAKASSILIQIELGGTKKIVVIDDGVGIENEDVKLAFLPHSTSKIHNLEDLYSIKTMGFRGEALSSICAVSQIELLTKTASSETGTRIVIDGGDIQKFEECATTQGTKIVVNNLFFNTPARQKFLRKPKVEESEITHLIEKFILANPNIKFKYVVDGKMIYNTIGRGCYDNIYTIYGAEVKDNLIEINYTNGKYKLTGYIGRPQISKPNRTYQTLFVNNRIIVNFLISAAIGNAYDNFLMKGKFPFYVLNLTIPFDSVDVNVHPSKQEIKFENTNEIYSFFNKAINEALYKTNFVNEVKDEDNSKNDLKKNNTIYTQKSNSINTQKISTELPKLKELFGKSFDTKIEVNSPTILDLVEVDLDKKDEIHEVHEQVKNEDIFNNLTNYKIIGTAFNTYIILEQNEKLLLIDQHACHERKLYDKFIQEIKEENVAVQPLMVPYTFNCNSLELAFFMNNISVFKELGFEIEDFGNNIIKFNQIPYALQNINFNEFINNVKQDLTVFNKSTAEILKDYLAKKACKSAVKAGDILTPNEINSLLKDLNEHKVLLCPHGRPIVVEVTKYEIEKWFKRKV